MKSGRILQIYLHETRSETMKQASTVVAEPGAGLVGDTYHQANLSGDHATSPDREVTLIEAEALEFLDRECGIVLAASESRRNLVTRGVSLNPLVGEVFFVGPVRLRGIRLCNPCNRLEKLTQPGVLKGLAQRGGLRAQILEGGTIREGDAVALAAPSSRRIV